jgi:hypothetical protein
LEVAVRLRNVSGYPLQVPGLGRDVAPGEVIDSDGPITGLAPVEDEPAKTPTKTTGKAPEKAGGDSDKETK